MHWLQGSVHHCVSARVWCSVPVGGGGWQQSDSNLRTTWLFSHFALHVSDTWWRKAETLLRYSCAMVGLCL